MRITRLSRSYLNLSKIPNSNVCWTHIFFLVLLHTNGLILRLSHLQQQSARFLGPPRERSPSLPGSGGVLAPSSHHHQQQQLCHTPANNNHSQHRPCTSCSDQHCEHDASSAAGSAAGGAAKHYGPSPIFSESCRR